MNQATLYTESSLHQAQIKQKEYEDLECNKKYSHWWDEDNKFDLDLEKWSVNTEDLKKPHTVLRWIFRCYMDK